MALRLPRDLNPFRQRTPKPLTARDAWEVAEPVRRRWAESDFCFLCCIYAGALEGEDRGIGPLTPEGESRLWHFDYYAAEAERFLRVQVCDGQTQQEETRIRAGGLDYPQMKFPFAAYGYREDRGKEAAPVRLPDAWADSPRIMEAFRSTTFTESLNRVDRTRGTRALVAPAAYLSAEENLAEESAEASPGGDPATQSALIVDDPALGGSFRFLRFDLVTGDRLYG